MRSDSSGTTLSMIGRNDGANEEVLEPHLFLLMNAARPREPSVRFRLGQIDEILLGRSAAAVGDIRVGARLRITVPDGWMSSDHATITREDRQWRLTDAQSKNGSRRDLRRAGSCVRNPRRPRGEIGPSTGAIVPRAQVTRRPRSIVIVSVGSWVVVACACRSRNADHQVRALASLQSSAISIARSARASASAVGR